MKNPRDVKSVEPELVVLEAADTDEPTVTTVISRLPAGHIVHDERGNAFWKWRGDTSSTDTTSDTISGVLQYLEPTDLEVEGQSGESGFSSGNLTKVRDAGGGYDPYNQDRVPGRVDMPGKRSRGKV
jgi:hypothetical protein